MRYVVDNEERSLREVEFDRQEAIQLDINFDRKNAIVKDEYFDAPTDEQILKSKLWCIANDVYINGVHAKEVYKELVK